LILSAYECLRSRRMLSANLAGSNATMTKDFRSDCVMSYRLLSLLCEALVRSRTAEGSNHRCLSPGPQPPQDDADQLINLTARNSACQNDLEGPPRTDCVLWVKGERLFGGSTRWDAWVLCVLVRRLMG
jgi:hypothetical protein